MLHGLVLVGQSDPQAAGLGGLVDLLRFLKFLKLLPVLIHHPVARLLMLICLSLVFAFVCAGIAARKGRSKLGWGILGLLFSIVTLIVLLSIPSKRPPERESPPGDVQKKVQEKRPTTSGAPEAEAHEKCTKVRCSHCQHVQTVPVSQQTFSCEQCKTHLKRRAAPANSS